MYVTKQNLHQVLACMAVLLNQLLVGYGWGWTAPTLVKLRNPDTGFSITEEQASWIASVHEFGKLSSPFLSPFIVDTIGRKYSVVLVTILFLLIWPSLIFVRDFYLLCVVRILFGIANGLHDVVASIYTTESCSTELRGIMGSLVLILFVGGYLLESILTTYLTFEMANLANTFVTICALVSSYFCVETPHFSIMKRKHREAETSMKWLRGDLDRNQLSDELEKLECNVREERKKQESIKTLFASVDNAKSMSIVLSMYWCFSATGSIAYGAFAGMIFSPTASLTSNEFNILYVAGNFCATCFALLIMERIGRRTLLIGTHSMIAFNNLSLFVLFYLHGRNYEIASYPWLVFASVAVAGVAKALSAPVMYIVRGELLPLSVRAIGGAMSITISSIAAFSVSKSFLPVSKRFGMEVNFFAYTVMTILTVLLTYYFLPETRGKSLDEIQQELKTAGINKSTSAEVNTVSA